MSPNPNVHQLVGRQSIKRKEIEKGESNQKIKILLLAATTTTTSRKKKKMALANAFAPAVLAPVRYHQWLPPGMDRPHQGRVHWLQAPTQKAWNNVTTP